MTPRARALAAALRDLRTRAGAAIEREISGRALSVKLGKSHGMVSNWETGERLPMPEDVASLMTALEILTDGKLTIPADEKERLLDLTRHASERNWLTVGMPGIPAQLASAVESERAANEIVEWQIFGVPGLLQTPEAARALAKKAGLSDQETEQRVMVRMSRHEILTRRNPVEFLAFISEVAFREPIGEPEVMTEQLRYLNEIGKRANVTIRAVPLGIGWHPGWSGPFVLYKFPDAPPVVHFEHHVSGAFVADEEDVEGYRRAVEQMKEVAMSPAATTRLIAQIADELEHTHERAALEEVKSQPAKRQLRRGERRPGRTSG